LKVSGESLSSEGQSPRVIVQYKKNQTKRKKVNRKGGVEKGAIAEEVLGGKESICRDNHCPQGGKWKT